LLFFIVHLGVTKFEEIKSLVEEEHSRNQKDKIVKLVLSDKAYFKALMKCFFYGEYRICQRAAYPLLDLVLARPDWFKSYFQKILNKLNEEKNHPSILRNSVRILVELDIPKKYEMEFLDKAIMYIMDNDLPVAIRAFAITLAGQIAEQDKDLFEEVKMVVQEQMDYPQKPAFRFRAKKLLGQKHR